MVVSEVIETSLSSYKLPVLTIELRDYIWGQRQESNLQVCLDSRATIYRVFQFRHAHHVIKW